MQRWDVLEEILIRGRAVFGAQFHFSEWYVRKVKPFYVKTAKREQCLCQYCLRFQLRVECNFNYVKALHQHPGCQCMFEYVKNPHEFRRQHICHKPDGSNYYNHNCTENICNTCSNLKLLQRCDCLNILPEMTWQKLESICYTTKNGEERSKIFCSKGHCTK